MDLDFALSFRGASGKSYTFRLYEIPQNPPGPIQAVYCYIEKIDQHDILYMDQTSSELKDFDEYRNKANCIGIHEEYGEEKRLKILEDIKEPPKYNISIIKK